MAAAPERPGRRAAPGGPGRELMARVFSEVLSSISFAICAPLLRRRAGTIVSSLLEV